MVYEIRLKVFVRFDEMESVLCDWLGVVGIFSVHSGVPLYLHVLQYCEGVIFLYRLSCLCRVLDA